jgi:hypothetical protein
MTNKIVPIEILEQKYDHLIMINDASNNDIIVDYVINYKHEMLQLNNKNILFSPNGWMNDEHLIVVMQILYVKSLQLLGYQ